MAIQTTLILLKPDTLQRSLVGEVISRIEKRGLQIVGCKMIQLTEEKCKEHYAHISDKPFYPALVKFMTSTPIIAIAVKGVEAVSVIRDMCGPTNAKKATPGTIRGDFSVSTQCNIIHASDSEETAKTEVKRFFENSEIFSWDRLLNADYTAAQDEK
jgi:nucleoside-diphosphate kinase